MKFNGLATVKQLYFNYPFQYIKLFFKTNIKTCFTNPKTIFYSQRYNNGEKFLLDNKLLYPYNYKLSTKNQEIDNINLSYKIDALLQELNFYNLQSDNKNVASLFNNKIDNIKSEIISHSSELLKYIRYVNPSELDLPVAVIARILFCLSRSEKLLNKSLCRDDEEFHQLIDSFLNKIRFSDAESLSLFLSSLSEKNISDISIWNKAFERLNEISFEPEFTKVTNANPHLFRYVETTKEDSKNFSSLASLCYFEGWRGVYLTYNALEKAMSLGVVHSKETLDHFKKRFDLTNFLADEKRRLI